MFFWILALVAAGFCAHTVNRSGVIQDLFDSFAHTNGGSFVFDKAWMELDVHID